MAIRSENMSLTIKGAVKINVPGADFAIPVPANITLYAGWKAKTPDTPDEPDDPEDPDGFYAYFDVENDTITYNAAQKRYEHVYTSEKITPKLIVKDYGGQRLEEGDDYTVVYSNNINVDKKDKPAVATITGKGNYKGSKKLDFIITAKALGNDKDEKPAEDITLCDITVKSGSKVSPEIYYNGYKLTAKDYNLTSKTGSLKITDADAPEDLMLTITGKGNFTGRIVNAPIIRIKKADQTIKVSTAKGVSLSYNGQKQTLTPEQLIVTNSKGEVLGSEYYKTVYVNNKNAGTAKVTVT